MQKTQDLRILVNLNLNRSIAMLIYGNQMIISPKQHSNIASNDKLERRNIDINNKMEKLLGNKDYSKMTLEELVSEEKKMKSQKIPTALFVGFAVGIAIWSATHKGGFFLTVGLLIFALIIGSRYSKNLKGIQTEISRRDTGQ